MKKKLTWTLIVALALVCVLTLAACGTTSTAAVEDKSSDQSSNGDGEVVYITAYDLAYATVFSGPNRNGWTV